MRRLSLRTPGRGGGRRGPGGSGRSVTGPLSAPRRAEESGPQFPQFLYLGAAPHQRSQYATDISRLNLGAVRASCRLMPFGRVAVAVTPCGRRCRPQRVKSLSSKVRLRRGLTWPLFREGLQASASGSDSPLLNSQAVQRPRHFLVSSSQTLPGVQDTALRFRSVPLAQTVSDILPLISGLRLRISVRLLATDCTVPPALATLPTTSIRGTVPVRGNRHTPHQRRCCAHRVGRSGPGPGGRLPAAQAAVFVGGLEPDVSSPMARQSRQPSHTSRPPPGPTLRFAPCTWSLSDS